MIALIQKVSEASVTIENQRIAEIGFGALALVGVEKMDTHKEVELLKDKILLFRMFNDTDGKMNLNIREAEGSLLLVPQFTLVADTDKGRRPGFRGVQRLPLLASCSPVCVIPSPWRSKLPLLGASLVQI